MRKVLAACVGGLLAASVVGSEEADRPDKPARPLDPPATQDFMGRAQEQHRKIHERMLENLRRENPAAYEAQRVAAERQAAAAGILVKLRAKQLSQAEAKTRLTPLIRQEVGSEAPSLDRRIAEAEKALASLKRAKADPDAVVAERVERLLGHLGPPPLDALASPTGP